MTVCMRKSLCFVLGLLILLCLCACDPSESGAQDASLYFLNVGKADACVIKVDGKIAVVDTGTASSAPRLIGALRALGIERVDFLFLTHTHADHTGGADALCRVFDVGALYTSAYSVPKGKRVPADVLSERYGLPLTRLQAGDRVEFCGDAYFEVLGPREKIEEDDNDNSLVMKLHVNGRKVLLTGDMQQPEENSLIRANVDLSADVLKVGNHGNPDATGKRFAVSVYPSVAIFSTDTDEDWDSANEKVKKHLVMAHQYRTQDYVTGIRVDLPRSGEIPVSAMEKPREDYSFEQIAVDKNSDTVAVKNSGTERTDLSGWMLISKKTEMLYIFPEGTVLDAGQILTVSADGTGDLIWDAQNPIRKNDTVTLYDRYGNVCATGLT